MKLLSVILLVTVASVGSSSLLELGQELWTRVLGGGIKRVGKLDPLHIPVIKVDQSEGNASYRVILRNLEVTGLNSSTIESVHIVRGKLKSNLTEGEAGYVTYNEQRGLDSIRYRFHTLIKEPKSQNSDRVQSASSQFERIVEYDPAFMRAREDEDFLRTGGQETQRQRSFANTEESRENRRENHPQQKGYNSTSYQSRYGDMRVAMNPTPKSPSSVRVVYTHNYKTDVGSNGQEENVRPCIGACKRRFSAQQQGPFPPLENSRTETRNYQNQGSASNDHATNVRFDGSTFSAEGPNGRQFSVKSGNNFGVNYQSGQVSAEGQAGQYQYQGSNGQRQNQFSVKSDNFGVNYRDGAVPAGRQSAQYQNSGSEAQPQNQFSVNAGSNSGVAYTGSFSGRNGQIRVQSNGGENYGSNGQRQSQFSLNAGTPNNDRGVESSAPNDYEMKAQFGGASFSANSGVKGESIPSVSFSNNFKNSQADNQRYGEPTTADFMESASDPTPSVDEYGYLCDSERERLQTAKNRAYPRNRFAEQTTPSAVEEFEPSRNPSIRLEKQPGYVDIVYAGNKRQGSESRSEKLRAAPESDPRAYGFEEIMADLNNNQRYIIHNFTQGESLNKRNDAARVAIESQRIRDLIRYAKEYQEKQGYFEEGMELIYHFGNLNNTNSSANDSLTRRKRQHTDDKDEEDVMHVIVRIRVPKLSVKSNYALMGKVNRQPVRGSGLLDGNFTDVTADFTVELKKVDNKTMIVRAARAKLVSKDRNVNLQGMNEKGPVEAILNHGLMAAEAVAAMIADDLASKALNEGNADGIIYKMYKNLPVTEKS